MGWKCLLFSWFFYAYSGYCSTKGNQATSPPPPSQQQPPPPPPSKKKHIPPLDPRLRRSEEINARAGGPLGGGEWKEGGRCFVLCWYGVLFSVSLRPCGGPADCTCHMSWRGKAEEEEGDEEGEGPSVYCEFYADHVFLCRCRRLVVDLSESVGVF